MGSYIRLVVTLTAIAAAASFGLSAVYNATHTITEEYKRLETENARIEVLPTEGGEYFEETTTAGRTIFRTRPDAILVRLGHPLMRRALSGFKRRLWEQDDGRWTITGAPFPSITSGSGSTSTSTGSRWRQGFAQISAGASMPR